MQNCKVCRHNGLGCALIFSESGSLYIPNMVYRLGYIYRNHEYAMRFAVFSAVSVCTVVLGNLADTGGLLYFVFH